MRTRWVIAIAVTAALIAGSAGAIGVAYFGDVQGEQGPAGEVGPVGRPGPPGPRGSSGGTFLSASMGDLANRLDDIESRVQDLELASGQDNTFTLQQDVSDLQGTVSSICIQLSLGC